MYSDLLVAVLFLLLHRSVHLPEGHPHGGPGRQGGLRFVQPAGQAARVLVLRQRCRPPRQARKGVVLLQPSRPVQQRHEARRRRPGHRLGPHQPAADVVLRSRPEPTMMGRLHRRQRRSIRANVRCNSTLLILLE